MKYNVTCDVYHGINAPPSDPDIAGVRGYLVSVYPRGYADIPSNYYYTHILDVPYNTDIQDKGAFVGGVGIADTLYIPDKNGTPFTVVQSIRMTYDKRDDHRRVFLNRGTATYPTNYL